MTASVMSPYVSIVIPARDEAAYIEACIGSLNALDYPASSYEVIVVDNGSSDDTAGVARALGAKVLERPGVKVGGVRNAGCRAAAGAILAFTDADCVVPTGWLRTACAALENPSIGAVGGVCTVPESSTWIERCWVTPQLAETATVARLAGSSFVVRRDVFDACGGFDESVVAGEDDKLSDCIAQKGLSLLSLRGCAVMHLGYPKTLMAVLKRQIWHARNSMEIKKGWFDGTFLATNAYLMSLVLFLSGLLVPRLRLAAMLGLLCMMVVTALHPARKVRGTFRLDGPAGSLLRFVELYVVYAFYFVGRSVGLAVNYHDMFNKWIKRFTGAASNG